MGILNKLFSDSDNKIEISTEELAEASACPNCWGQQ